MTRVKILICSDAHCDRRTSGVDRYEEVAAAMQQTVDAAIRERVDLYAFLGDLADPDDGPDVIRALDLAIWMAMRLTRAHVGSVWIPGNHDVVLDGQGQSILAPLGHLDHKLVAVPNRVCSLYIQERPVVIFPYPSIAGHAERATDDFAQIMNEISCSGGSGALGVVLGHATEIDGAKQGEETLEMARGKGVRLPTEKIPNGWVVANGHFHTPQVTPGNIVIPGALARLTHGEESNQPRFLILNA